MLISSQPIDTCHGQRTKFTILLSLSFSQSISQIECELKLGLASKA